uniref:Translocon at the inner envelope membrane of chloroplasts 214 n=1 Tax=Salix viminalis TaxID=40686 RepID=A0A6N2KCN0_SALVM
MGIQKIRNKKDKDLVWFEKPRVTILFDYKRWNRPFRYIKNDQFKNAVRKEMSQYFFSTCRSDGKERISFTYPPKRCLCSQQKNSSDELYNHWNYNNEQKKKNLSNEFINRVEVLDKGKQIPRWSYKLIDDLEQQEGENEENAAEDHEIRSRKAKRVVIFTDNQENPDSNTYNNSKTKDTTNFDQTGEVALIRYSQQSDFRRDIIKGSMRTQRRKIAILKLFQANLHSPFFWTE